MYEVIDRQTQKVICKLLTLRKASRKVDKLDLEYGACRYFYRKVDELPTVEVNK